MRKSLAAIVAFCVTLLWCSLVSAQKSYTPNLNLALPQAVPGTWGADYNNNFTIIDGAITAVGIPRLTVATKPASPLPNQVIVVTDALNGGTCTVGGGTSNNTCQWNGSAWVVIGGGTGGGVTDFSGLTGTASDAQIPNLNVLSTGLTATRCVQTDGSGLLTVAAGPCPTVAATGTTGNITVSAGGQIDLGTTAVQTDQTNTYTTGDQNMAAALSWTQPIATGAAPTASGRCAYDSTANRMKCGFNGTTVTLATLTDLVAYQPLHPNLTALAGLTGVNNTAPIFTAAGLMTTLTLDDCPDTGGNHWNYDAATRNIICGTSSTGGISGGVVGNLSSYASATTLTPSGVSIASGILTVPSGLVVGSGPDFFNINTSAYAGHGDVAVIAPYVGAGASLGLTTGALVNGDVVKVGALGQLVSGGVAGTGNVTLAGPNVMNNTTLDESAGNIIKITKSIQPELYGPTTDNVTCTGCYYFRVPVSLNGANLTGIQGNVVTPGTTGTVAVQVVRCAATASGAPCSGTTANMLSTVLSIDSGENSSSTAATAAVINTANDDVATGQILRLDVTAIHTTPAKGLFVNLDFKLP